MSPQAEIPRSPVVSPPARRRVQVPLWLKMTLTFGTLVSVAVAGVTWSQFEGELEEASADRQTRMLRLAQAAAERLDGDELASFCMRSDMERPEYAEVVATLRWIRDANALRWAGIYGRDGDRDFYVVDAEDEAPLPLNYPCFDRWRALDTAFDGQAAYAPGLVDEYGRWDSAFAPVRDRAGHVAAVVALDLDADWRDALMARQLRRLWLVLALVIAGVFGASLVFSRVLARHLMTLAEAASEVAAGDLGVSVEVRTRDEVGLVGSAFNEMVVGLRQRAFMHDAFGRYVTPEVVAAVLADPAALELGGELRTVTMVMSDLRGFTSLSEERTAAEMVDLLNDYLGRMSTIIVARGGTIIEFIGDAIMVVFGAPHTGADDPLHAVACAVEMQLELEAFNLEHADDGTPPLEMGVGVHTGRVIVGNIGSATRTKYGLVGDDVNLCGRIESFTVGGEVLISEVTWELVREHGVFRGPLEVRPKGKKDPVTLYAVVAMQAPGDTRLQTPLELQAESRLVPVDIPGECFRISGKSVARAPLGFRAVKLGHQTLHIELGQPLHGLESVKLKVLPDAHEAPIEDLYAKVRRCDRVDEGYLCELHFTSVPASARARLDALIHDAQAAERPQA